MEKNEKQRRVIQSLDVIRKHTEDKEYKEFLEKILQDNSVVNELPPEYFEEMVYFQEKEIAQLKKKN